MNTERRLRLAMICREGSQAKMDGILRAAPAQWDTRILVSQQLDQHDIERLTGFDIVFYKSHSERLLRLLSEVEKRGVCVVNPIAAVRTSRNRFECLRLAADTDVPIAQQFKGPLRDVPFDQFVIKTELANKNLLHRLVRSPHENEQLTDELGPDAPVYAQAYIESDWEYKLYCIGEAVYGFRQRPVLVDSDAMSTRHRIDLDPTLRDYALRAMHGTGLEIAGADFLVDHETPRLTDLNSTPGLNKFPEGSAALVRYFARRGTG